MTSLRRLVLSSIAFAAVLLTLGPAAGAESYDTTDGGVTVDNSSGGSELEPGGTADLTSTGWGSNSSVNVELRSDPVFLGTFTANSVGTVTASVRIPETTPAGDHHIVLTGTDAAGNPRSVSQAVTVVAGAAGEVTGSTPDSLSFTGATALPVAGVGLLVTGVGVTLLRFRRRRLGVAA